MIIRGGTGFRAVIRILLLRNWAAVLLVLAVEVGALGLHQLFPGLQTSAFSAGAIGVLAAVVGIFVAFRFNEAYGRWWEARTLWGGMVNASRTFGRQVIALLGSETVASLPTPEQATTVHRELVYRHLAYVNALRLSLRGQPVLPEIRGYLPPEEIEVLGATSNIPAQIAQRQSERLASILGANVAEQILATHVDNTLTQIVDLQGGMERIKNTAFPDRVIVVTRVLVWLVAVLVAVAFIEPDSPIDVFEFGAILVIVLSFLLVKQLGEELNDPFESRPNDTPMSALCRTIEIDLRQQLKEREVPPPLEPVRGVLM